nr:MAG: nonstructural protein [Microviridae sp.]
MKQIYCVKDNKSGGYMTPVYNESLADAQRNFGIASSNPETMLYMYPADWELWYLGTFNQDSGQFNQLEKPEYVCNAAQCQKPQKPEVSNGSEKI